MTVVQNTAGAAASHQAPLQASRLIVTNSTVQRHVPLPGSVEQWEQNMCSDHMVTCRWTVAKGWEAPRIVPYGDLAISPAASCLNYATTCFEGMKAFRGHDGKLRLFRPDCNINRLATSAQRVCLPAFDERELIKLVKALLLTDAPRWLPKDARGRFIYIRPAIIGSGAQLGIQAPKEALLYIMMVPWPDYSKEVGPGPSPRQSGLRLYSSRDTTRAWPGGFGFAKVGANYGTSLGAAADAQSKGYDQVLWLFGPDERITEAGASNFCAIMRDRETGVTQLVTAPLTDKIILDGVTRRSILALARERLAADVEVVERSFTMAELESAWEEGRVVECFVCGTAFFVTPVSTIHYKGRDLDMPIGVVKGGEERYSAKIAGWLRDIQYGAVDHEWAVVVEEDQ